MSLLQNTNMLIYSFPSFIDVDDDYDEDGEQAEEGYHDLIDTSMKQHVMFCTYGYLTFVLFKVDFFSLF